MATTATTGLRFHLLGPLQAVRDGASLSLGGERQRGLLALLLLHANELLTTEYLAEQLFGAASESSIRAVRVAVSRLRRLLDDDTVVTRPGGYLVRVDPEQLDLAEFEALVAQGRAALGGRDPADAALSFRRALALFRGPPLADLALLDFVQPEIRRLEELRLSAQIDRLEADLALGRSAELVPELESLVHANPFQERLRGQLMLALYRSGRQTDGLEVYRRTRELLADELGLEPSRALQQLERAMLQHDPALDAAGVAAPPDDAATCPFKGLAAFEAADAFYFCGREHLLDEIVTRLASGTFLGIVGPSGVGKSSLLRAGILPALAVGALPGSATWPVVLVRGGDRATAAVHDAVDACRLGERVVIAVDQLEEIFADDVSPEDCSAFLDELERAATDSARRVLVLIAVRADFYGRFADYPRLADRLSQGHVFVRALDRDDLARAIEVPAARAGLEVERPLVDELVADTSGAAGALPLLQTTLLQLWAARDGRVLRHGAYRATGGLRGAVARLAEETFTALPADDQEIARRVMLRLAGGDDGALVRRRLRLADLHSVAGAAAVVDALVAARLLAVDGEHIELSHEALLQEWPRYRQWLEDDRVGRRVRAHLTAGADVWDAHGRDSADLYRGARLSAALELPGVELSELEREFLDASRAEADRELNRQRQHNRRLRILLAGVVVLLAAVLAAGVVAFQKTRTASHEARLELAGRLGNEAVIEPRIDRAMLLARESLNLDRSVRTEGTLLATLLRTPAVTGTYTLPIQDHPQEVKVSPDGRTIAVVTNNNLMRIFDTRTHRQTNTFPASYLDYAFVPTSGDLLVQDPRPIPDLLLKDARTGRTLRSFTLSKVWQSTGSSPDEPMAISRDGRFASLFWTAVNLDRSYGAAYMELWPLNRSGPSRLVPLGSSGLVVAAALSGDRVIAATDGEISTWNMRTSKRVRTVRGPRLGLDFVNGAISPDGRTFAYGLVDGTVHFFDIAKGKTIPGVGNHSAPVERIAFSSNSRLAVSVGDDSLGIVWNPATGKPVERLAGHVGRVLDASFSHVGATLYAAGLDGTILQYDLSGTRRFGRSFTLPRGRGVPRLIALPSAPILASGNGSLFATSSLNRTEARSSVEIFSARTLQRVATISLAPNRMVGAAAWAGRRLVVGADGGLVQLWNVGGKAQPGPKLSGLSPRGFAGGLVRSLSTGDAGRVIAAIADWWVPHGTSAPPTADGQLAIWRDRRLIATPLELHTLGNAVAVSPDGSTAAVATDPLPGKSDGRVLVVDTRTGRPERTIQPPNAGGSVTAVAFSRDGLLATGTSSGIVQLWNPRSGQTVGRATLVAPAPVASIAFSPDGKTFATSGGSTGGTRVWVTATQQQLGSDFPGGDGQWGNVAYTAGRYLLAVFSDGTAYRWPVSLRSWESHACAIAGRNFTREEWARYLGTRSYSRTCPGNRVGKPF